MTRAAAFCLLEVFKRYPSCFLFNQLFPRFRPVVNWSLSSVSTHETLRLNVKKTVAGVGQVVFIMVRKRWPLLFRYIAELHDD